MSEVSIPGHLPDWVRDHILRYLESDGADGHMWDLGGPRLVPTLLLTTTGRKSGKPQLLPLIYGKTENGYAIVASKGGAPSHPLGTSTSPLTPRWRSRLKRTDFGQALAQLPKRSDRHSGTKWLESSLPTRTIRSGPNARFR